MRQINRRKVQLQLFAVLVLFPFLFPLPWLASTTSSSTASSSPPLLSACVDNLALRHVFSVSALTSPPPSPPLYGGGSGSSRSLSAVGCCIMAGGMQHACWSRRARRVRCRQTRFYFCLAAFVALPRFLFLLHSTFHLACNVAFLLLMIFGKFYSKKLRGNLASKLSCRMLSKLKDIS